MVKNPPVLGHCHRYFLMQPGVDKTRNSNVRTPLLRSYRSVYVGGHNFQQTVRQNRVWNRGYGIFLPLFAFVSRVCFGCPFPPASAPSFPTHTESDAFKSSKFDAERRIHHPFWTSKHFFHTSASRGPVISDRLIWSTGRCDGMR